MCRVFFAEISEFNEPKSNEEKEKLFASDFLDSFPTQHSGSYVKGKGKNTTKKSQSKITIVSERSSRQERRNARERGRKARLNAAFQVLRSVVPRCIESCGDEQRKLTQVEILRLAKNYICSLTTILQYSECKNLPVNYSICGLDNYNGYSNNNWMENN